MESGFKQKTPEELKAQKEKAESLIDTSVLAENDSSIWNLPPAELKRKYPERYRGYVELLRHALNPNYQGKSIDSLKHTFRVLNGLEAFRQSYESGEDRVLLPRQFETFLKIQEFLEDGQTEGHVVLPTGMGKTVIFAKLLESFTKQANAKVLVVGPTKIILHQNRWRLEEFGEIEAGAYFGEEKDLSKAVTVTTYASLRNGIKNGEIKPTEFDVIILDEAHRALGENTSAAVESFPDDVIKIGFTATPEFHEEKSVADLLPKEIDKMTLREGIEVNLLAGLKVFLVKTKKDLSTVERIGKDYDEIALEKAVNTPERNTHIVSTVKKLEEFKGKKMIAYCGGRQYARDLDQEFKRQGFKSEYIDGSMRPIEKEVILTKYKHNEIEVLCNAELLIEGFDEPEAEVCINAIPTLSKVVAEQRGGRVLRRSRLIDRKVGFIVEFFDDYGKSENTPVLFSEVAGAAEIMPEEPEIVLDDKKSRISKSPVGKTKVQANSDDDIVFDPETIMAVTNRNRRLRYDKVFEYAPKNWSYSKLLAHECGTKEKMIREYAEQFETSNPEWYKRYLSATDILVIHYHPDLVNKIRRHFLPELAETVTPEEFADQHITTGPRAQIALESVTESHPDVAPTNISGTLYYDKAKAEKFVGSFEKESRAEDEQVAKKAEERYWSDEKLSEEEKEEKYWETVDRQPSFGEKVIEEKEGGENEKKDLYNDEQYYEPSAEDENRGEVSKTVGESLKRALTTLEPRERRVIEAHFLAGKTFDELGEEFHVTRERVRQIMMKGLRKLRHPTRIYLLDQALFELGIDEDNEGMSGSSIRELFVERLWKQRPTKIGEILEKVSPTLSKFAYLCFIKFKDPNTAYENVPDIKKAAVFKKPRPSSPWLVQQEIINILYRELWDRSSMLSKEETKIRLVEELSRLWNKEEKQH